MSDSEDKKAVLTNKRLALADLHAKHPEKSQRQLAKEVGLHPVSVSRALSDATVKDLVESNRSRHQRVGRMSYAGVQEATGILARRVSAAKKKLDDGGTLDDQEIAKIIQLQDSLLRTSVKVKEAGLEVADSDDVSPEEAAELAEEMVDVCRLYASVPPENIPEAEEYIREQVVSHGAVDLDGLRDYLSADYAGRDGDISPPSPPPPSVEPNTDQVIGVEAGAVPASASTAPAGDDEE